MSAVRSYLYVPADRADRLARAPERGADALIVDLEDGVAPARKLDARRNAAAFLADGPGAATWVRVNASSDDDVIAVAGQALRGIVVPKAETQSVARVGALLDRLEAELGLRPGSVRITALCETARAVLESRPLASMPRVDRLALGETDLCAELGLEPSPDGRELLAARSALVLSCGAAGIDAPTAGVRTDFRDLERFRDETQALRRLGFGSRSAIHPAQVAVINEVFTPAPADVAAARRLVELFEAAGGGACVDDEGRMVDEAVVRAARRTIARARQSR